MTKLKYLLLLPVLLIGVYLLLSRQAGPTPPTDTDADLILFWGQGCPHCEVVKDYISQNNLDSKLKISQKEVYYNKANQKLMEEKAKQCPDLNPAEGLGVPFAFVDGRCVIGDQPIIEAINQKIAQQS